MAVCPLCQERAAKRFCPAKHAQICAICCATLREVEIDCPSDCAHLKAGRSYEDEKKKLDPALVERLRKFDDDLARRCAPQLDAIAMAIIEERASAPYLLDRDVIEACKSVGVTLKTRSSGIYYQSAPEGGPAQVALFRRLVELFDGWMAPQSAEQTSMKISEAQELIEFASILARMRMNGRPRSRQYLDWLNDMFGAPTPKDIGLIVP